MQIGPENAQGWKLTKSNLVQRVFEKGLWSPSWIHLPRRRKKIRDLQE